MMSLRELLDQRAHESGDAPFLFDAATDRVLSYRQVRHYARRVTMWLVQQDVQPGSSVAYAMHNSVDTVCVVLGIFYGGYRATAINLVSGSATIAHVLAHSETQRIIAHDEHLELLQTAVDIKGMTLPPVDVIESGFLDRVSVTDRDSDQFPPVDHASDGLLMYTSGTTGVPKGVVLTHASLHAGGSNTASAHQLDSSDRALCVLPLFHINGLCVTVLAPLVSGGSVVMPMRFSVSSFWQLLGTHRCSWFSVVPTQIAYLLHGDEEPDDSTCQQVRFGRSASAPLAPEVQEAFERRFKVPIVETMGLTETAAQILSNPLPPGVRKTGSPGIAFGNEVRIAGSETDAASPGEEGEVWVRGDNVMSRYLHDDAATSAAKTSDGWLRTGDLGRMDDEGYVFITGRLKELIIKGGENIAPREIDEALYGHGDVIEAAAFARDCDQYGQRVEAAVFVREGSSVAEADLLALCQSTLGKFKTPDRIYFMAELPKGPSGKIQRLKLGAIIDAADDS